MDRLTAMRTFATVAELGGFAAAARRLRLSPPTVTRAVAGLEEHLGVRLMQRTTRTLALTAAGTRYLERVRAILADLDDAERGARSEHSAPSGRFVLAAPTTFGRREVAPLMCDFLAAYPAVTGELTLADRVVDLIEDGVDAAVRIGVLDDSSLRLRPVGAIRRVAVASPDYLAAHRAPRTPRDLTRHRTIQFTSLTPTPEWRFATRGGDDVRVPIRPTLTTNSADAAVEHAVRGGGVALVLSYQVIDRVSAGALVVVLERYEPPPIPIQIVYPGGRLPSANVRAFIDLAVATRRWSFLDLTTDAASRGNSPKRSARSH